MAGDRVLVPVAQSGSLRPTVEYAVDRALEGATPEDPGSVRFVVVHSPEAVEHDGVDPAPDQIRDEAAEDLLERVAVWAEGDAGDDLDSLSVETGHLGREEYLFSPDDVARVLDEDATAADADLVVVDPRYDPGVGAPFLHPMERALRRSEEFEVVEAPVERPVRRAPLLNRATPLQLGSLFGVAFVFYQLLAGAFAPFDVVTGAVTGTIVAVALARVSISRDPDVSTPVRLGRACLFVPYLLFEIVKANVAVAVVILHPRLPIEPRLTRIRPAVWGSLPVTTLANSITLTPGTLTVRVDGRELLVHTLIPGAREDLFDGGLERAVRFVFYGRRAARIDSLRDRGETEVLPGIEAGEDDAGSGSVAVATDGGAPTRQGGAAGDTCEDGARVTEADAERDPDAEQEPDPDVQGGEDPC